MKKSDNFADKHRWPVSPSWTEQLGEFKLNPSPIDIDR